VAEILEFGENPDRKVHRLIGVRHFANPEDRRPAHFGNGSSEIAKRWKARKRIAVRDIGIREFGVCVDMRFLASRVSNSRYAKIALTVGSSGESQPSISFGDRTSEFR
jgi:hypothetical protein